MSADSYEHWSFYDCIWWGLMTLTTVGYHIQPQSFLGKLSCGLCALCGVFIITLPIPIGLTANVHTNMITFWVKLSPPFLENPLLTRANK